MEREHILGVLMFLQFVMICGATPPVKDKCHQIVDGYDCSALQLDSVPDAVSNTTQNLDFSFNLLPSLYKGTFTRLQELLSLDLTRCRIDFMYEDVFATQAKLQTLILTGNPLTFMSGSAFFGLKSLVHLIMPQTSLEDLEDIPGSDLQLETLDVSATSLHTLDGLTALNLNRMKALNLARNHITSIHASDLAAFKGTKGTIDVSFVSNDLFSVEPGAFRSLHLKGLDFTDCFTKVDISMLLRGLEGLTVERLKMGAFNDRHHRYIKTESLDSLCHMTVTHLNLQIQRWEDLSNATFKCMGGLKVLEMTEMHIKSLPENITTMGKLSQLTLDRNGFNNMCDLNAHNFPSLTSLSMRGLSEFTKGHLVFQADCLQSLSQLEYLDLSHSTVHVEGFCCERQLQGLGQLRLLNLSYNDDMHWHDLPFSATPQLRHLDCSHVSVNLSGSAPFRNLPLLETLNLSRTSISATHSRLLEGLKSLVHLNLRGNPVSGGVVSDPETFKHVPLLESIVLAECELTAIEGNLFYALTKLTYADLNANYLTKLSTSAFFSLAGIRLNFAHNRIELVDIGSVNGLGPESLIDLSYNPLACNCSNIEFIDWVKANVDKLIHFEETLCGQVKFSGVNLHCNRISALMAYGILTILIIVVVIVVVGVTVKKIKNQYRNYTQL